MFTTQTLAQFQTEQHIDHQENARTMYAIAREYADNGDTESAAYWQELAQDMHRNVLTSVWFS